MTDEEITEEIRRRFIAKFGEKQFAEAMERATPLKIAYPISPNKDRTKSEYNKRAPYCYHCGAGVRNQMYCRRCGQRLDWSGHQDTMRD